MCEVQVNNMETDPPKLDLKLPTNKHQFKSIVSGLIRDPRILHRLSMADVCNIMKNDLSDSLVQDLSALEVSSKGVHKTTQIPIIKVTDFSTGYYETDRSILPDSIEDCRRKSYYERLMIAGESKNFLKPPGHDYPIVKHNSFDAAYMFKFRKNAHIKPSLFSTYFRSERNSSYKADYGFRRCHENIRLTKNKCSTKPRLRSLNIFSLQPDQIYRLGQTKLYWRSLPAKKFQSTDLGETSHRESLTVLLCTNFNGTHKLKPLVVGSCRDIRVIKNFEAFVIYKYSKDAKVTASILHEWFFDCFLNEVSTNLKVKGISQKSLLFLDPSVNKHPPLTQLVLDKYQTKTVKLSTEIAVDQTVVGLARIEYKKRLLLDAVATPNKFTKLGDAIAIIRLAWDTVKPFAIQKCCQFVLPSEDKSNCSDSNPTEMLREMQLQKMSKMEIQGLLKWIPGGKDLLDSEINNWIYFDNGLIINKNPFF